MHQYDEGNDQKVILVTSISIISVKSSIREQQILFAEVTFSFKSTENTPFNVVLLHCGCLSLNPFIEFSIRNNSSSSDVLYIQASISPKFESK